MPRWATSTRTAARTSSIPLAWIGCGSAPPRPGPSWLDTRPLGLVGPSSDRTCARRGRRSIGFRTSVARRSRRRPPPARPGRGGPVRRSGSSLVEVPLTAITSGSNAPSAQPHIDRTVSQDGHVESRLAGRDASAHARAAGHGDDPIQPRVVAHHPAAFLHEDVLDGEFSGLVVPGSVGTCDGSVGTVGGSRRRRRGATTSDRRCGRPRALRSRAGSSPPPRWTPRAPSPSRSRPRRRSTASRPRPASTPRR